MGYILKNIFRTLGEIISLVWNDGLSRRLRSMRNNFYTGYLSRRFKRLGKSSIIEWKALNIHGAENISIGNGCTLQSGIQLTTWQGEEKEGQITIGDGCTIRFNAHITSCNAIIIGDNLLTGTNVLITDNAHGGSSLKEMALPPCERKLFSKGKVNIGNNVWLGNNVCVLPGVTIGDGAIVGAGAIVTEDIPAFSAAAGVPAKIIRNSR